MRLLFVDISCHHADREARNHPGAGFAFKVIEQNPRDTFQFVGRERGGNIPL